MEKFLEDRREALLSRDIAKVRAFYSKWNPTTPTPADDHILELSMHKAITGAHDLPRAFRLESKRWLAMHDSTSLDDGTLTDG